MQSQELKYLVNDSFGKLLKLLFAIGFVCLLAASPVIAQQGGTQDNITITDTQSPTNPKERTVTLKMNFVTSTSTDVAIIILKIEVDNQNCAVTGLDFSDFKTQGAKVKRKVVHGISKDYVEFTISLPAGHSLPPTAEVDVDMIDVFATNPNVSPVELTEATSMVKNGTDAYKSVQFSH